MNLNNLDEQPSLTLAWGDVRVQTKSKTPHQRKISDPIHGFMYFDTPIWKVVDTPVYQRLRNIKQLGAVYQVYQGANHTRFEHSLGVGYLGHQFIKQIFENQPDFESDKAERERKVKLVTIAGVVHDLGHGPFSHMFDNLLIPKLTNNYMEKWTHEEGSQKLFEYLCQQYETGLEKQEIQFIIDLVHGKPENGWISEIVANYRNGLDVDKMDYLNRDSKQLGMAYEIRDFELLMKEARVIENKICYPTKYADNLLRIYDTRHKLYRQVYLNRVVQAVELMIADILIEVNPHFKFEEIIYNPSEYFKLNDSIIEQIDNTKKIEFTKAQSIIQRIKTRNLYKFVAECQIPYEKHDKIQWDSDLIQKNIHQFAENVQLSDIYIMIGNINYGTSTKNPLELITYYKKYATDQEYKIVEYNDSFSSYCRPNVFLEKYIRLFTSNPEAVKDLQLAFNKFCHHHLGSKPSNDDYVNGTPQKKTKQD